MSGDLLYALRALRRRPAFTLTSVLTLALGLGLAGGVFAFADGYLFRPLPFPAPDQLYRVVDPHAKIALLAVDTIALRQTAVGAYGFVEWSTSDRVDGDLMLGSRRVEMLPYDVSPGFGQIVGVPLHAGRWFRDDDHRDSRIVPAVLSHRFWRREFGGDPAVLNQTFRVEGPRTSDLIVVGILAPEVTSFDYANEPPHVIVPELPRQIPPQRRQLLLSFPFVRLPDGVSRQEGEARIGAALQAVAPAVDGRPREVRLQPLREWQVGGGAPTARVLLTGALLILLLVVVNLVHLLLAQGVARSREIATRAALGASRWRLMRPFLLEGLAVGVAGIAGGLLVGLWMSAVIAARVPLYPTAGRNLSMVPVAFDLRVIGFIVAIGFAVALIGGALPVWRAMRRSLNVGGRGDGTSPALPARLSRAVLASELAVATILLLGAVFIGLGIWRYLYRPLGYRHADRVIVNVSPTGDGRLDGDPTAWTTLRQAISAVPGVRGAGMYQLARGRPAEIQGPPLGDARVYDVVEGYFEAWQTDLTQGRWFTPDEYRNEAPLAIVDAAFARRAWPGASIDAPSSTGAASALGQEIRVGGASYRVIGVVDTQVRSLRREPSGEAYVPRRAPPQWGRFVAWAPGLSPGDLEQRLAPAVRQLMPSAQLRLEPVTMTWLFNRQTGEAEFQGPIMAMFGVLTFALAGTGIFGLVSYLVVQRTRELGIRIALGASRRDIWRGVLRDSVVPAAGGLIVGVAGAWLLERYVRASAFGWEASGAVTVVVVTVAVLSIAVLAAIAPARRALRVDPVIVLRAE